MALIKVPDLFIRRKRLQQGLYWWKVSVKLSRVLDIKNTIALQKGVISSATAEAKMIKTLPLSLCSVATNFTTVYGYAAQCNLDMPCKKHRLRCFVRRATAQPTWTDFVTISEMIDPCLQNCRQFLSLAASTKAHPRKSLAELTCADLCIATARMQLLF